VDCLERTLRAFFNVPFGYRKKPRFLTELSLINISKLIRNVNFSHKAFDDQMINYERGDFFYLDPPYVKMKKTSFVNYLPSGFSNDDFIKLLNFCKELDDQDCFFTLSNSVNPKVFAFARDFKTLQHNTNSLRGYNMNQLLITNSCNKLA
jgi:DNA adenine methylase